jgi:glycolate oxidase
LPTAAQQIAEVVELANRRRIPVVPRAGGTGLTDGAVPLRHGIMVDVKLMNRILEIDHEDRTVTVQPGINMLKLNEELRKHGYIYPDNPASYPCSLVGGRIGTSGWSLIGGRYGHTRDLVISFEIVLPTGERVRVGDGGGPKVRKSSSGYQLKHLFMGHQGTLGIVTEATLELVPRPEAEFSAFFAYPDYASAWHSTGALARSGLATLAGVVLFDEWKVAYLRRDDEAYIPQTPDVRSVVATAMYGTVDEVRPAAKRLLKIGLETGGADELALRGRFDPVQPAPRGARKVARDRGKPLRALRHVRRLGDVRLHERSL